MDPAKLSKVKRQLEKLGGLKSVAEWGPEYQIWEQATQKAVLDAFGQDAAVLFSRQQTVAFSYIDDNRHLYLDEIDRRKRFIETLLSDVEEEAPIAALNTDDKNVLKHLWANEEAIKENLLTTQEVQALQKSLISHLENTLKPDSLPGLRFRKMRSTKGVESWWSNENGYPLENPWPKFQPFLDLLAQHEAAKTIKHRLETEGLFVESRSQGEDQHLLIGERDGSADKAHLIIDGKSGEIRTEDGRTEPTELASRIETILTLKSGKKIRSTREAIEEIQD